LRHLRLNKAKELLRQGWTIKSTAYELGFKQPSHFSREFKRQTGTAPASFAARVAAPLPLLDVAFR
jgi:AraC-like DNA-binding protein